MVFSAGDMYRILFGISIVAVFFITGRPYFSASIRVLFAAATAGLLNAFLGAAAMGTPLSGIPLRFCVAFVGVGAGVAALEYLFPEGRRGWRFAGRR